MQAAIVVRAALVVLGCALLGCAGISERSATSPPATNEQSQLAAELRNIPRGVPVVMLNMLKFRDRAVYASGDQRISGRAAYQTYRDGASKLVAKVGGGLVWRGETKAPLIAPAGEKWDEIFLVRYPSIEKFIEMVSSPEYRKIVVHREAALADSRLIANVEVSSGAAK
jgi:uncharacterized protein (DUF1330 family)